MKAEKQLLVVTKTVIIKVTLSPNNECVSVCFAG